MQTDAAIADAQVKPVSRERWLELAPTFHDYNYRQIWEYGLTLARRRGAVCEHVAVLDGAEVIALADVRIKRMPVVGGGIAYISGGPLTRRDDPGDMERLKTALAALVHEYCSKRGFILRVLAPLGPEPWNGSANEVFRQSGFCPSSRSSPYRTLAVDISRPLADVRTGLTRKWRNHLNASERKGQTIRHGTDDGIFAEFCVMFAEFNRRKGFEVELGADFYRQLQGSLSGADQMVVSLAEVEGSVAAGLVSTTLGDTSVYLLGATNESGLKTKAAYLLQWDAIGRAKARGAAYYDLGGIDPDNNPGVYEFKSGMGGRDVSSAGPFEYMAPTWRTRMAIGAEGIYQRVRRSRANAGSQMLSDPSRGKDAQPK